MKTVLHKSSTRGHFNHGWLDTYHTFSFADYFDHERINFGALRVLNDDVIAPGAGFGMHTHNNMEIVSIPLSGALEHKDSLGHTSVIRTGEIQVMSAGTGIHHSEYNQSKDVPAEFLQIWIIPARQNVEPRYESAGITDLMKKNQLSVIVSPYPGDGKGLWIYQKAWFSLGKIDKGVKLTYTLKSPDSLGVYLFVIKGKVGAAGYELTRRDGVGLYDAGSFDLEGMEGDTWLLVMEVPPIR